MVSDLFELILSFLSVYDSLTLGEICDRLSLDLIDLSIEDIHGLLLRLVEEGYLTVSQNNIDEPVFLLRKL